MNLLKLNAVPLVLFFVGVGVAIIPVFNQAENDRITENGIIVTGKINRGSVTNKRRSFTDKYELEVSYGAPGGTRTTRSFEVSEEFYAANMSGKKSVVTSPAARKVQVRCNPDDPKEAWIVGAEPDGPISPILSMGGGALLMAGGVWYFLSLKQSGKLFRE